MSVRLSPFMTLVELDTTSLKSWDESINLRIFYLLWVILRLRLITCHSTPEDISGIGETYCWNPMYLWIPQEVLWRLPVYPLLPEPIATIHNCAVLPQLVVYTGRSAIRATPAWKVLRAVMRKARMAMDADNLG